MRILQIKQAECALADGRLDEACELAAASGLRSHHRGQKLIGRLVRGLLARGERHLAAGNARGALADCDRAVELGGNLPEAAELRGRITEHLSGNRHRRRRRGEIVTAAREHIENGRLTLAEQLLADTDGEAGREELLRQEAAARRSAAEGALRRAAAALKRRDHAAAIEELLTARSNRAENDETAELAAQVVDAAAAWARQEMIRGRVDLGEPLLLRLKPLAAGNRQVQDLLRVADECRGGWRRIRRGELRPAGEILRRAASMLPEAKWLKEAAAEADRGAEATESLRSGPLGMLGDDRRAAAAAPADEEAPEPPVLLPLTGPLEPATGTIMPRRFLLQLDGADSSLVFRDDRVTIGPISSSPCPELGLLADPNLPGVMIERTEGDYFLRSAAPVGVNDKSVTGRLLADGDKIALSPRCSMRFRLPNAASGSAVLELSTARLPQADVRRVVLLDREMIVGPGAAAHIRADQLPHRAVLHLRDGRLLCRTKSELTIDHEPLEATNGIPLATPVRIGPLGLVVTGV